MCSTLTFPAGYDVKSLTGVGVLGRGSVDDGGKETEYTLFDS